MALLFKDFSQSCKKIFRKIKLSFGIENLASAPLDAPLYKLMHSFSLNFVTSQSSSHAYY